MKKFLKICLVLSGLLLVSMIAIIVAVLSADPNNYKDWITERFAEETGRTLVLDGNLEITVYPWLGLEANGMTISNAPGFGEQPFLHVDHVKGRIKLVPALLGKYEIDTVRLHGAEIHLARNQAGETNWSDLMDNGQEEAHEREGGAIPLAAVVFGGVDIQDLSLTWDDEVTGDLFEISGFSMNTDELVYGEPIQLTLVFDAVSRKPDLATHVNLDGTIHYDIDKGIYDISPLNLASTLRGVEVPEGKAELSLTSAIRVNLGDESLSVSNINLSALGTVFKGDLGVTDFESATPSYTTTIDLSGQDLAVLFRVAGIEPLATQLAGLPDRGFAVTASVDADMQRGDVAISGLNAALLGASITGDIKARNIQSPTPQFSGRVNASGPDLPTLLQVLGRLQGADSALSRYGKQLRDVTARSFVVKTQFDADMKSGDVSIPTFAVDTLGIKAEGNLVAKSMQKPDGTINGKLNITAGNLNSLLMALDQPDLAGVLQSVDFNAGISGTRQNLVMNPMDLKLVFSGKQIPNSPVDLTLNANTVVNLDNETLNLNNLSLTGLGLNIRGNLNAGKILQSPEFNGQLDVASFNLRKLMQQLNQDVPDTADKKTLEKVALVSTFDGSQQHINISKLDLVLDDSIITGALAVRHFNQPAVEFGLNINDMDLDRYLPPKLAGQSARPITPETAAGAATQLPVETLRSLNIKGDARIGKLVVSKISMADVAVSINAQNGNIRLAPVSAKLYEGGYSGDIRLDATGEVPGIVVNTALQGLQIDPFLQDFMGESSVSGTGNLKFDLTATGADTESLKRTLNGQGQINLANGVLRGVDVARVLAQVEIMVESKRPMNVDRGEQTAFKDFSATIDINNGVVSSDNLLLTAPGLKVTGKGILINLLSEKMKYDLLASADQGSATRGEERYNIGGYTIPIQCRGMVSDPKCVPDLSEVLKVAVQKEVQKQIGDVLQKALGLPAQQPQAQPTQPDGQTQQPQQQQPAVDPKQELINKALKSIFDR